MWKYLLTLALLMAFPLGMTGCNTAGGLGRDTANTAEWLDPGDEDRLDDEGVFTSDDDIFRGNDRDMDVDVDFDD